MIGIRDNPRAVILYSDRGGSSGKIVFATSPSPTISLSWISNTRGAASGRHLWISLGRFGSPFLNSSRIQDFHFDSIRLIVSLNGQSRSTGSFFSYAIVSALIYSSDAKVVNNCLILKCGKNFRYMKNFSVLDSGIISLYLCCHKTSKYLKIWETRLKNMKQWQKLPRSL